eukprot:9220323-Heterocapsa_arctica.AAC.1
MTDNAQVVAALLGTPEGADKVLDEKGKEGPGAHPWLQQLLNDLKLITCIEGGDELVHAIGGRPLRLWLDFHVRGSFLSIDLSAIRAAFYAGVLGTELG